MNSGTKQQAMIADIKLSDSLRDIQKYLKIINLSKIKAFLEKTIRNESDQNIIIHQYYSTKSIENILSKDAISYVMCYLSIKDISKFSILSKCFHKISINCLNRDESYSYLWKSNNSILKLKTIKSKSKILKNNNNNKNIPTNNNKKQRNIPSVFMCGMTKKMRVSIGINSDQFYCYGYDKYVIKEYLNKNINKLTINRGIWIYNIEEKKNKSLNVTKTINNKYKNTKKLSFFLTEKYRKYIDNINELRGCDKEIFIYLKKLKYMITFHTISEFEHWDDNDNTTIKYYQATENHEYVERYQKIGLYDNFHGIYSKWMDIGDVDQTTKKQRQSIGTCYTSYYEHKVVEDPRSSVDIYGVLIVHIT